MITSLSALRTKLPDAPEIYGYPAEAQTLVYLFFVTFARFECALKQVGIFVKRDGDAEPDWDTFSNSLRGKLDWKRTPELADAIAYLMSCPPRKEVVAAGELDWTPLSRGAGESHEAWLLRLVRRIRNNLFHGGKGRYPYGPVSEPSRDSTLLYCGLVVLSECLSLSPEVDRAFKDPLH